MDIIDYFPEYTEIGYTKKSLGIQGKLRFFVEEVFEESIFKAEHCFFVLKGCMVPYFIDSTLSEIQSGVIKFESTDTPEESKELVSKAIYLHKNQILDSNVKKETLTFDFLVGFEMRDSESEAYIGVVKQIEEYPEQEIAIVVGKNNVEYLIPLNEFNFKGTDEDSKLVFVEIPEGLLDLYN